MAYNRPEPQVHHWLIPHKLLQCGLDSIFIRVSQLSAIFFMQLGGVHCVQNVLQQTYLQQCTKIGRSIQMSESPIPYELTILDWLGIILAYAYAGLSDKAFKLDPRRKAYKERFHHYVARTRSYQARHPLRIAQLNRWLAKN
jgi:hypothetical protein